MDAIDDRSDSSGAIASPASGGARSNTDGVAESIDGFRVSPQQALWWRLAHGRATHPYWSVLQLAVDGALDPAALQRRLAALTAAEELLRTRLHAIAGMAEPVQVIDDACALALVVEDLRGCSADERAARLAARCAPAAGAAPWAIALSRISDAAFVLTLCAAASHADEASLRRLAERLLGAAGDGDGEAIAAGLQHADYAEWKADVVATEAGNRRWTADAGPALLWREAAGPRGDFWPDAIELAASAEPPRAIAIAAAQQLNATLEELLLASWLALLARCTGQSAVSVAWFEAGRGDAVDRAIGPYAQSLPVSAPIDRSRSLLAQHAELLGAVRSARAWRDAYDSSVELAAAFVYRPPCSLGAVHHERSIGQRFGIRLECADDGERLRCALVFDRTAYTRAEIECLAEAWALLAGALVRDLAPPLGAIPLVGPAQRAIVDGPPVPDPAIEPVSIVALIERRIAAAPDAPAVVDDDEAWSYRALDRHARRIAALLHGAAAAALPAAALLSSAAAAFPSSVAAAPGEAPVIGILMPLSRWMVAAVLAVLRSGAAYLPLDPAYPPDRLAYMLGDSGARIVLSTRATDVRISDDVRVIQVDDLSGTAGSALSGTADSALSGTTDLDLERPAYLIYTSGTTGQPKAVEISHRGLSHSTQVRMAYYRTPVRAYLLLSSFSFDSSVAGLFWTLCSGGCLVLPASGDELDVERLVRWIREQRVSHGLCLPTLYQAILESVRAEDVSGVDTWIVAGEACRASVVAAHAAKAPGARLVNEYGPTEATVWATADVLDAEGAARGVSIGRAIPTMRLVLRNEWGAAVGVGELGEIFLGGPALARGYRGKPAETAAAFVVDPDGERAYRTGDLARWRADGKLAFHGRRDHQVKIRGHRVELPEIERALVELDSVRDAAVVVQRGAAGDRIVAYVVRGGRAIDGEASDGGALRRELDRELRARLPEYMVPAAFVVLPALPLGPTGKVDSAALPDPDAAVERTPYEAPRTPLETALAEICADVLRVPVIGIHDNFFQIGGDSISSLKVVARAGQRGIRVTAKQLFERQTVAQLAEVAVQGATACWQLHAHRRIDCAASERAALARAAELHRMDLEEVIAAVACRAAHAEPAELVITWTPDANAAEPARNAAEALRHCIAWPASDAPAGDAVAAGVRDAWPDVLRAVKTALRGGAIAGAAAPSLDVEVVRAAELDDPSASARTDDAPAPLRVRIALGAEALTLTWSTAGAAEELDAIAAAFAAQLGSLGAHAGAAAAVAVSAQDFPTAELDERAFQELLGELALAHEE